MKRRNFSNSIKLFREARKVIPGGVNSPVRAFKAVKMDPLFISKAKGAYVFDEDRNKYIDYVLSWGPMILGHADPGVTKAVSRTLKYGTTFGAPTKKETTLAKLITKIYSSVDKVRLTSSGTEAAMGALRLARGYTDKPKIIKFEGCYHGHFDSFLIKAGSGSATFGVPTSRGVNKNLAKDTIAVPFNDIDRVEKVIKREKNNIACVVIEPIPANMGLVFPERNFLRSLRKITKDNNILLIFDEVITGFRAALGGAQEIFGIEPDLTILGKIIGGGFPIGAFGGSSRIMNMLSPEGEVYQAGTLSGNPVAVEAGINTIQALMNKRVYKELDNKGKILEAGLKAIIRKSGRRIIVNRFGSLFTLFFTDNKQIKNYNDVCDCDLNKFAEFFRGMLNCGIYFAPSQFEVNFISTAHKKTDIDKTLNAAEYVLDKL